MQVIGKIIHASFICVGSRQPLLTDTSNRREIDLAQNRKIYDCTDTKRETITHGRLTQRGASFLLGDRMIL